MDIRKLSYFLAVVDHGTFTRAAEVVFVSQPGLSQGIRDLETELGVALFDRIGRRVKLTDAGRALEGPARQALRQLDTAASAVEAVKGFETGQLDLGCLPTLAGDPAAAIIGAFRREHPNIMISLADPTDPNDLLSKLRTGVIEMGFTERLGTSTTTEDLVQHDLMVQQLMVIRPPGSKPLDTMSSEDLVAFDFVASPPGSSLRHALDDLLATVGGRPRIRVETAQREAIVPLVLAGAGAALVTDHTAKAAAALGAVVCGATPLLERHVVLVHRHQPLSPAASKMLRLATTLAPKLFPHQTK